MILWSQCFSEMVCSTQYEFIVVNSQTSNYDFCISQGSAATILR